MRKRNDVEKQRGKGHYHAEIASVDGKIMAIISRVDYREMDPYGSHYYDMEETKRIPFKSRKAARKYLKSLGFEFEKTIFDTKKKDWLSKSLRKRKVSRKTRARNQPLKLTTAQIKEVQAEMVPNGVPVRFLKDGQCLNIETGEQQPKGINVMYQMTYWNFKRSTAYKIIKWLGVKAKFDEKESNPPSESTRVNILISDRIEGTLWSRQWSKWCVDQQGNWFDFVIPSNMAQELVDSARKQKSFSVQKIVVK